jgi:hypothetical protein
MNKDVLKISHDNTHSTSRIFRNVKLLKKDIANDNWGDVEKRLDAIEKAATECREQVDKLYLIFKIEFGGE